MYILRYHKLIKIQNKFFTHSLNEASLACNVCSTKPKRYFKYIHNINRIKRILDLTRTHNYLYTNIVPYKHIRIFFNPLLPLLLLLQNPFLFVLVLHFQIQLGKIHLHLLLISLNQLLF